MNNQEQVDNQKKDNATTTNGGGNVNVSGDISGSGIVIGHHITTGNIKIELDQSIKQNPNNEYLQGLKELTEKLEKEYEKYKVPKEKQTEINQGILDLEKEVKDLKPEAKVEPKPETKVEPKPETKVKDLEEDKQKEIKTKTRTLMEKIVDVLPEASETIANLTPFSSPFSKLIKTGVQTLVDNYKKYKESQS